MDRNEFMIKHLNPETLSVHPAAQAIPRLAEDSPEFWGILASIATAGIIEPLKIKSGSVVDGRERQRAAILLRYATVPCIEIADGEVTSVIFHSLLARKHYTKSALAYIAQPIFEATLSEARKRQLDNLKAGIEIPERQLSGLSGKTAEDAADRLGINRQFLFVARNIRGHFAKNPALKDHFEPRILSGELGLGAVMQGIAGWNSTKGQPKQEREQLLLWAEKIKGFGDPRKWAGWDKATPEVKEFVRTELRKAIESWPEDIRAVIDGI